MLVKKEKYDMIVGIDEVGRGPLAGSVCVGAVVLTKEQHKRLTIHQRNKTRPNKFSKNFPGVLRDSKKLSESQRKEWVSWIRKNKITHTTASVPHAVIDATTITRACNRAAQKVYDTVARTIKKGARVLVIADGSLMVRTHNIATIFRHFPKADETVSAVSLASIVAKVSRDAAMIRLAKKYPQYGFDEHKGYGTQKHIHAIKKHGPSPIHRASFLKNICTRPIK